MVMDDLAKSPQVAHARTLVGRVMSAWVMDTLALRRRGWDRPGCGPSAGDARADRFALPSVRPAAPSIRIAA